LPALNTISCFNRWSSSNSSTAAAAALSFSLEPCCSASNVVAPSSYSSSAQQLQQHVQPAAGVGQPSRCTWPAFASLSTSQAGEQTAALCAKLNFLVHNFGPDFTNYAKQSIYHDATPSIPCTNAPQHAHPCREPLCSSSSSSSRTATFCQPLR
jgi:hypothetical protein